MDTPLWRTVAASAVLVIALGACSNGDDEDALDGISNGTTAEQDGSAGPGDDDGASDRDGEPDRGSTGSEDEPERDQGGEPLGTATGQQPANPNDDRLVPLRIDVTGLDRNRDLVELQMTLTNESDLADLVFEPWSQFESDDGGYYDLAAIGLVDQAEQKLYLPVVDSEGTCLCTGDLHDVAIGPGESVDLDATFGGLADDVEALDLHVPGFDPITDLEVAG